MGKGPKQKTTKEKVVKTKVVSTPVGNYQISHLIEGKWVVQETRKAKGRRALMDDLGGYKDKKKIVNLNNPQVKVRAA